MQKLLLAIFAMATLALTSCSSTTDEVLDPVIEQEQQTHINLHLGFSTSESAWTPTRALSATAADISRIALTIFDATGAKVIEQSQYKTDADFGTFQDLRLTPGTYTFAIVAHKAATTEEAPATITSATSATLSGQYFLDTYATTQTVTIQANATQDVPLTVPLCVTRLHINTLDKLPSDVQTITLNINPTATAPTALTFNPTTGLFPTASRFTRTLNVSSAVGKTFGIFINFMADAYPATADVLVEARNASGDLVATRTFTDLTFHRAKIRTIQSYLFSGTTSTTLTFEEWTSEDPITIE